MEGSTDAVRYYSEVASEFDASYAADANRLERLRVWRGFLDRHAAGAQRAYDLGCGSGVFTVELASRGIETTGIDGAQGMLEVAARSAERLGLANVRFEQRLLPFDPSGMPAADLVISSSVVEYLDSVDQALASFRELLREGGILIFSLSNRDSLSRKLVRAVHALTGKPSYFGLLKHMLTAEEVAETTRRAGFTVLEQAYFGAADTLNRALAIALPPRRTSNMLIVAARRTA